MNPCNERSDFTGNKPASDPIPDTPRCTDTDGQGEEAAGPRACADGLKSAFDRRDAANAHPGSV